MLNCRPLSHSPQTTELTAELRFARAQGSGHEINHIEEPQLSLIWHVHALIPTLNTKVHLTQPISAKSPGHQ